MYLLLYYKFNNCYFIVDTTNKLCQTSGIICRTISQIFDCSIDYEYHQGSLLDRFITNRNDPNFSIIATSDTPFSADSHPELLI